MNTPPVFMQIGSAIKDMSGEWRAFMGMPGNGNGDGVEIYGSLQSYAKAPADETWVQTCIARIMRDSASTPLRVYIKGKNSEERTSAEEGTDQRAKDIQFLLDNVNDQNMTGAGMKMWHALDMKLWGEDYWLKVRGRLGGAPQELHWLRPSDVEPQNGNYRHNDNGTFKDYKPQDVIATRFPNPANPLRGLSPLSSIRYDLSVNKQATLHTAYTLANWGMPPMAWVAPKDSELTNQDQTLIRRALRALRGPRAAGKTPILPGGLEPKVLSLTEKDAEWLQARKISRMTVCAAIGVPLVLAGDDEKSTVYANLRDAERVYWRGTVTTLLDSFADTFMNWLLPDFGKDARDLYEIAFDYSQVEALRPELTAEMNAWDGAMDRGAVTPNEYRRHFRLGPDVPWGDDPIRGSKLLQEPPVALPAGMQPVTIGVASDETTVGMGAAPAATPFAKPATPTPAPAAGAAAAMKGLYRNPVVKAWLADTSAPLQPVADALGLPPSDALRVGLMRRYSPGQMLDGVPAEGYRGLFGDS